MPEPTTFRAVITFHGYGDATDLEQRLRRAVETHPTLSFRLDKVVVEQVSPTGRTLPPGDAIYRIRDYRKQTGATLADSRRALEAAGWDLEAALRGAT